MVVCIVLLGVVSLGLLGYRLWDGDPGAESSVGSAFHNHAHEESRIGRGEDGPSLSCNTGHYGEL